MDWMGPYRFVGMAVTKSHPLNECVAPKYSFAGRPELKSNEWLVLLVVVARG